MKCISLKLIFIIVLLLGTNKVYSTLLFSFPSSVTLSNGNILVVEKYGIYVCDSTMETIIKTAYTFIEEDQISDGTKLSNVVLKDKNDYIGVLVNFKLHLLTRTGDLIKSTNRLISENNPTFFSFAPIFVKSNNYYYVITYFDSSIALKLFYFKISLTGDHSYSEISNYKYEKYRGHWGAYKYSYRNEGLSCEYMLDDDSHKYNYLVCYVMIDDGGDETAQDFYEITESKISDYNSYICTYIKINNVKLIKTLTIRDIKRALVFIFIENNGMYQLRIYTYYYEYTSTHLDLLNSNYYCANNFYSLKTNYIYETDLLSFSCIGSGTVMQSILFNNNLNIVQTNNQFDICESINGHSVIYSQYYQQYYIISDVICYNHQRTFIPLIGEIPIIEEEVEEEEEEKEEEKSELVNKEEKEEIEENFYQEEKEEEAEIEEKEYIEEEENQETELQFECTELLKCSRCDQESISRNLCIKCDNEKGYYFLNLNNNINSKYIDCVNDETKPYNFYFDSENEDYEACFDTCFQCN